MTGAPVPKGADPVVRVEDTEPGPGDNEVTFLDTVPKGKNICWQAEDVKTGEVVLRAGHAIRAPEAATLAACGRAEVPVYRKPTVAVLSTGDEVVPIDRVPTAGQIRDANSHYVAARLSRLGIDAVMLGIAPDNPAGLEAALSKGLAHDVLVASGGVSMGDYDLVPGLLRKLGTELYFEKVAMKPGRPTVFGRCGQASVFGLPGNPVSVLATCELFVVPALRKMMGFADVHPPRRTATLAAGVRNRPGRVAHRPALLEEAASGRTVRPLDYHGSAHVHALSRSNCLIVVPADVECIEAGSMVEVIELHV
jgi:molybdopterin molybdotransferase